MRIILLCILLLCVLLLIVYLIVRERQNVRMYDLMNKKAEIEERLEIATTLNKWIAKLTADRSETDRAIEHLLGNINDYFESDRCYIFEMDPGGNSVSNTYEYAVDGVTPQKDNLQHVSLDIISDWMVSFRKKQVYYMENLEQERGSDSYDVLEAQDIDRLLAVPLWKDEDIIGFLGVDNPRRHYDDPTLLSSIQYFITSSIFDRQQKEQLRYLSYRDILTGTYNRNKYMNVLESFEGKTLQNVGIADMDLNGLKLVNDTAGHEAGDILIRKASSALAEVFPEHSYRIGGDEFVILMTDISEADFRERMSKLQDLILSKGVSISTGIVWRDTTTDVDALLKEADARMYEEKKQYHEQTGDYRG